MHYINCTLDDKYVKLMRDDYEKEVKELKEVVKTLVTISIAIIFQKKNSNNISFKLAFRINPGLPRGSYPGQRVDPGVVTPSGVATPPKLFR